MAEFEAGKPRSIGALHCVQYRSTAEFFIDSEHPSGVRHLIVRYEKGGCDGELEMAAEIPENWTMLDIADSILGPEGSTGRCPKWEVPLRIFGSKTLFRWWTGEKPPKTTTAKPSRTQSMPSQNSWT